MIKIVTSETIREALGTPRALFYEKHEEAWINENLSKEWELVSATSEEFCYPDEHSGEMETYVQHCFFFKKKAPQFNVLNNSINIEPGVNFPPFPIRPVTRQDIGRGLVAVDPLPEPQIYLRSNDPEKEEL